MNSCSDEEYFQKLDNMVLRSTKYLRQIFKQRWKNETGEDWRDQQVYIQNFLSNHCENVLHKAIPLQKKILFESCTLEEWDISLMTLILLNFGDETKCKLQNKAIFQLKTLRNQLAHHKSKKFTQCEYSDKLEIFKKSLQVLGIKKCEIKDIIKKSGVSSSSEDTVQLKSLLSKADQLTKLQKFEDALNQYSEALKIPRLSSTNIGKIYEKRAACYLNMNDGRQVDGKHIDQAILDVEQALKLDESSWNAIYLKAQCHKAKNNLAEAIRHYEMALALSPVEKKVKQDLDSCRIKYSTEKGTGNFNLDQLPKTLNEIAEENRDVYGNLYTLQEVAEIAGFDNCPLYLGEKYYQGAGVPQNFAKAYKYFKQADKKGYAVGCFKLGLCYYHGHGVPQDLSKAVEIFKRCATMDPKMETPFQSYSPLGFNNGVASAENFIGLCYEEGTGVEKNLGEAAIWYTKSMEHGHCGAATHLGFLHYNGNGIAKNDKMAMMCWKQGLNLGSTSTIIPLVRLYCEHLEPEMAWIMFRIGREIGNSQCLDMSDATFNKQLTMVQSQRCRLENKVTTLEKERNLSFKGMTFKERSHRKVQYLNPNYADIVNWEKNSWGGQIQNMDNDIMMTVMLRSLSGSTSAQEVFTALNCVVELDELLERKVLSKADKLKTVNLFYECIILESNLKQYLKNLNILKTIVEELFFETCQQINEEDMKARLCYINENLRHLLKSPDEFYALGILKEGLRRYPDNYYYHRSLINCFMGRQSFKTALQCVNDALKKFPDKVDLLFLKAHIIFNRRNKEDSEIISVLKVFLENAPSDHKYVPEAYYIISFVHMHDYINHEIANDPGYTTINNEKMKMIRDNFKCGKDAENDQLPCYQPYGVSFFQTFVKGYLAESSELKYKKVDATKTATIEQSKSVLERKDYLKSPVRKGLILQHRERLRDTVAVRQTVLTIDVKVLPGELQQKRAAKMARLKAITLQEMNPIKDRIYDSRILDVTILEEPNLFSNSIQIVAEDDNGDTVRIYVELLEAETISLEQFSTGSRIAIINPYMGICCETGVNGIRINEHKCIMNLQKVKDMCRFCGEENAIRKCSKCKRLYCSRECQKLDWQLFQHKLICSIVPEAKSCMRIIK